MKAAVPKKISQNYAPRGNVGKEVKRAKECREGRRDQKLVGIVNVRLCGHRRWGTCLGLTSPKKGWTS